MNDLLFFDCGGIYLSSCHGRIELISVKWSVTPTWTDDSRAGKACRVTIRADIAQRRATIAQLVERRATIAQLVERRAIMVQLVEHQAEKPGVVILRPVSIAWCDNGFFSSRVSFQCRLVGCPHRPCAVACNNRADIDIAKHWQPCECLDTRRYLHTLVAIINTALALGT